VLSVKEDVEWNGEKIIDQRGNDRVLKGDWCTASVRKGSLCLEGSFMLLRTWPI